MLAALPQSTRNERADPAPIRPPRWPMRQEIMTGRLLDRNGLGPGPLLLASESNGCESVGETLFLIGSEFSCCHSAHSCHVRCHSRLQMATTRTFTTAHGLLHRRVSAVSGSGDDPVPCTHVASWFYLAGLIQCGTASSPRSCLHPARGFDSIRAVWDTPGTDQTVRFRLLSRGWPAAHSLMGGPFAMQASRTGRLGGSRPARSRRAEDEAPIHREAALTLQPRQGRSA